MFEFAHILLFTMALVYSLQIWLLHSACRRIERTWAANADGKPVCARPSRLTSVERPHA